MIHQRSPFHNETPSNLFQEFDDSKSKTIKGLLTRLMIVIQMARKRR